MSGEEEENAAELKIGDEFLKAKCLMNCEVALILEHKYEQLQQTSDDPMNQVSQVFEKSLQYVKRFSRYKNPDAVRQVREILARYELAEFELCVLGNLCPETVEEAIAMVPSIKSRGRAQDDEAIEKMLNDLSLIKNLNKYVKVCDITDISLNCKQTFLWFVLQKRLVIIFSSFCDCYRVDFDTCELVYESAFDLL
uniref:RNA polymerase Rpb4/RPC9 core domain-containing protein n=1 Tax=Glycine max TaxID=3847 RepID=C6T558_SOYBN|nr:unknown [Glycine max]